MAAAAEAAEAAAAGSKRNSSRSRSNCRCRRRRCCCCCCNAVDSLIAGLLLVLVLLLLSSSSVVVVLDLGKYCARRPWPPWPAGVVLPWPRHLDALLLGLRTGSSLTAGSHHASVEQTSHTLRNSTLYSTILYCRLYYSMTILYALVYYAKPVRLALVLTARRKTSRWASHSPCRRPAFALRVVQIRGEIAHRVNNLPSLKYILYSTLHYHSIV